MTKKNDNEDSQDIDRWKEFEKHLPEGGVAKAFPTKEACRERLASVRWPGGTTCLKCQTQNVGYHTARSVYYCRSCDYQFTAVTGTLLQSSKLHPQLWFEAAEEYIKWRAAHMGHDFGVHAFAEYMGVAYPTAWRMRKILKQDLGIEGGGLLARCICPDLHVDHFFRVEGRQHPLV
ncbi:transposase [Celeribacter halophilus]|uniref:transposase n=1 Tax=Celeribacter halophilus TaxID=576117 RepID=UPI003A8E47C4